MGPGTQRRASTRCGSKPAKGIEPHERRRTTEGRPGRPPRPRMPGKGSGTPRRGNASVHDPADGQWLIAASLGRTDRSRARDRVHRSRLHERSTDCVCDTDVSPLSRRGLPRGSDGDRRCATPVRRSNVAAVTPLCERPQGRANAEAGSSGCVAAPDSAARPSVLKGQKPHERRPDKSGR